MARKRRLVDSIQSGGVKYPGPTPGPKARANGGVRAPSPAKIEWSAPKLNTVAGNPRNGSYYREGVDPETGRKFHMYAAEAGGLPREVFGVGPKKPRGLKSKMK